MKGNSMSDFYTINYCAKEYGKVETLYSNDVKEISMAYIGNPHSSPLNEAEFAYFMKNGEETSGKIFFAGIFDHMQKAYTKKGVDAEFDNSQKVLELMEQNKASYAFCSRHRNIYLFDRKKDIIVDFTNDAFTQLYPNPGQPISFKIGPEYKGSFKSVKNIF
jgi:hypothetical protein